jgi:hypothetical protein
LKKLIKNKLTALSYLVPISHGFSRRVTTMQLMLPTITSFDWVAALEAKGLAIAARIAVNQLGNI